MNEKRLDNYTGVLSVLITKVRYVHTQVPHLPTLPGCTVRIYHNTTVHWNLLYSGLDSTASLNYGA